jgi:AcrR family transcriptional regulator
MQFMNTHQGQIVEYIVRKNGYSISSLAKALDVNRRSMYNWFNQKELKWDVIRRIGHVIRHDFSKEFPLLFTSEDFNGIYASRSSMSPSIANYDRIDADDHWKAKYLNLLEKYNTELLNKANRLALNQFDTSN